MTRIGSAGITPAAASATYAAAVQMVGTGIDPTGAADSTSAMQSKIDGAAAGSTLILPVGIFRFSALTLTNGKTLRGAGFKTWRDAAEAFGDAAYQTAANFSGTVLRSTASSGAAITFNTTAGTAEGGTLEGFILVGPGSGTAVGIQVGAVTNSVIGPIIHNVKVCNFAVGVQMQNVNEGVFNLAARGCTVGVQLTNGVNNNDFTMLNLQRCTTGLTLSSDCLGNGFFTPISQNNGTGFVVDGKSNTFYSPYCEVTTVYAFDFVGGAFNTINNPYMNNAPDAIRIQASASYTQILGFAGNSSAPIEDNGTKTFILGLTSNVTGTGTGRAYIDVTNNRTVLPKMLDSTLTGFPVPTYTSGTRPSATGLTAGIAIFNASSAKPNWTDGIGNWRDAAGTIV